MALREPDNVGLLFVGVPIPLTLEHVGATNIPLQMPPWQPDTIYPTGAMVSRNGKSYVSTLTEAASYLQDCPHLYNNNFDPDERPIPYVPYEDGCKYAQAGMAWWAEVDPAMAYVEVVFNYNQYCNVDIPGAIEITVTPPEEYDMIGIFGVHAEFASVTVDGFTDSRDLFLFPNEEELPYGPYTTHSDRTVWILDAPVSGSFSLTLTPRDGISRLGNLVVARRHDFGVTNYNSTIGIRDYSRKRPDDAGNNQIVPRWYQDLVTFQVEMPASTRFTATHVLIRNKDKALLYVGHDNPEKYELQIFGMQKTIFLPLPNSVHSIVEFEVESIGVPKWVSGIPAPPPPPIPPPPEVEIPAPWLAIGHDKEPYITVVNTITWQRVDVNFEIPGPARAVLFSPESEYLYIGHECPPYFTIVETAGWTALPDQGTDDVYSSDEVTSSDPTPFGNTGTVFGLSQPPDGSLLCLTHECSPYLTVLTVPTWQIHNLPMTPMPRSMIRSAFSLDAKTLLVTDSCFDRYWLSTEDYAELTPIEGRGRAGVFYWDGTHAVLGYRETPLSGSSESYWSSSDGAYGNRVALVRLSDWLTADYVVELPGEPYIIKWTNDRKYIAVGHRCAPYITVIDTATWETVETYFDHFFSSEPSEEQAVLGYNVCSLDFTFDSLYLAAVFKHDPYCIIIRTGSWWKFYLTFQDLPEESS